MPCSPTRTFSSDGEEERYTCTDQRGKRTLRVAHGPEDTDFPLMRRMEGLIQELKASKVSTREFNVAGHPAVEGVYELEGVHMRHWAFYVGGEMFQVQAATDATALARIGDSDQFFRSFRLLEPRPR
jgi:hypothetical protein